MKLETGKPKVGIEAIVGVLIPTGWNEQFGVTAMALACDGEREVAVGNLGEHPEMHTALRKRVRARGVITLAGAAEVMDVVSYRLVEETEAAGSSAINNE